MEYNSYMIAKFKIGRLNLQLVLRHRWEDNGLISLLDFKTQRLGLWLRRDLVIGVRKRGRAAFDQDNLVSSWSLGLDLIVGRVWIGWDLGARHFKLEEQ
jgi:hypothetical protein